MEELNQYELTISDVGSQINAFEFGYFLYNFKSLYSALTEIYIQDKSLFEAVNLSLPSDNTEELDLVAEHALLWLRSQGGIGVTRYWMRELPYELDLDFTGLSMNSPLKFTGYATGASILILSVAVAISGGKAKLGKDIAFELPPIAKSIRDIRDAFGANQPRKLPSEQHRPPKKPRHPKPTADGTCT